MARSSAYSTYFAESAQPLTGLVYVLPILAAYELGIVCLGPAAMRNGADVWLRALLDNVGFSQYFLLPLLTCGWLVGWHHVQRQRWTLSPSTLGMMLSETTFFALLLAGLGLAVGHFAARFALPVANTTSIASSDVESARIVGLLGAGIYEEVVFRLLVIPAVAGFLKWLGEPKWVRLTGAAVASSLLFAAAHYDIFTGSGEAFEPVTFIFRFLAGLLFATIFIFRGFGIVAGVHTLYDILVGVLIAAQQ